MIQLPTKEQVKEGMVQASRASIKEKTGVDPTEEELNSIRDYYNGIGDKFISTNMEDLKVKCDHIEQEATALPVDITSIPVELALPNDIVTGMPSSPNPLSVVEKFRQKINGIKSRTLATLVIIAEVYRICEVLHITVPDFIGSATKTINEVKSKADNMRLPIVG